MPGDAVTCTYTNTADATITVTKDAVPDAAQDFAYTTTGTGGGTLFASGTFLLDDDADATLPASRTFTFTGADATGTKTITETLPVAGWTLTNLVCSTGTTTLATGLASIALCPVTRSPAPTRTPRTPRSTSRSRAWAALRPSTTRSTARASRPFTRDTAVANPTTSAPFAFTGLQLGTKDVQETPEPGWTLTNIVCTANGAEITIGTGIGGTFAQGATAGFDPGDATVRAVITAGDTPTCTYTNTADATITVTKDAVPDGAQDFAYTTTGTGGGTLFGRHLLPRRRRRRHPEHPTFTFTGADATGTKTIQETLPVTGWTLTNLVCSKGTTTLATGLASIALVPGDAVTCTYTNTLQAATITVTKDAVPDAAQDFAYTTTGTGGGTLFASGTFLLDDDADATLPASRTFTFTGADATGTKTITETRRSPAGR